MYIILIYTFCALAKNKAMLNSMTGIALSFRYEALLKEHEVK